MNLWTAFYLEFAGLSHRRTTDCAKANSGSRPLLRNEHTGHVFLQPIDALVAVDAAIDQSLVANGSDKSLLAQYLLYRF
jgi:hypothetical protein